MSCVGENSPILSDQEMKSKNCFDGENDKFIESGCFPSPTASETAKKIVELKHLLAKDPKAADFKWSLFVSACHTYRYDTCLKPFPPMFIKNETKDIESLRQTIEVMPPLSVIMIKFDKPDFAEEYGAIIDLLHWALIRLRDPYIKSVNKDGFDSVLARVPSEMPVVPPNLIFQVASAKQSASEEKWRSTAQGHARFYAYHGSRIENFHSILHYGLQQHMCKTSLYGEGIYLSSELGVSLSFSPVGYSWGASLLGSQLSCIALCELINHPDVKRGDSADDERNMVSGTMGGKVPCKYFVVRNNELVRIRYLLVYSQEFGVPKQMKNAGVLSWFKRHKLLTFILGYVILLASVGLAHNKDVEKYYRLFIQKAGLK